MSYIAQYAIDQLPEKERLFEEFSPVEIDVLDPVWTLTEKLCALHNFGNSYVADSEEIRARFSTIGRHYYDVHAILSSEDIITRLNRSPNLVADIEARVAEGTRKWKDFEHTTRPAEGFAHSPAFDMKHPCMEIARPSYERLATLMLMGYPLPPFDNCLRRIQDHAPRKTPLASTPKPAIPTWLKFRFIVPSAYSSHSYRPGTAFLVLNLAPQEGEGSPPLRREPGSGCWCCVFEDGMTRFCRCRCEIRAALWIPA